MAAEGASASGTTPGERHAIGISFGNSNSSIAYTTIEDKAEVIANEDGGMRSSWSLAHRISSNDFCRQTNSFDIVICGWRGIQRATG
jgi:molecular chaperone DnaK (HSP70)